MKRFIPIPGDLIIVDFSEWYALRDGERLRVCENDDWTDVGQELCVVPRRQANTFWGPDYGPPDGRKPETMSTSGGPFKKVRIAELEGLELVGSEVDKFWCWQDRPRARGGLERLVEVAVWRVRVLPDEHYRELVAYGCPTHRDEQPSPEEETDEATPEADSPPEALDRAIAHESRGVIRLGCLHCDRTDFDGIDALPDDWADIHEVQTLAESVEEAQDDESEEPSPARWETHLGVCPSCRQQYERSDVPPRPQVTGDSSSADTADAEAPDVHPLIKQIINRDCHVGESNRDVIRHVISKLRDGYQTFRAMSPADRCELIDQCVRQHRWNRREYVEVMSGLTHTLGHATDEKLPSVLTGKELVSLMRRHKMTIEALAFRLGTSQKRVRQIRTDGLYEPLAVRDWIEAITGTDPGPLPKQYCVRNQAEIAGCAFCGCPLEIGDTAYEYVGEVFCSTSCCRKSRGW